MAWIDTLFRTMVEREASDLHLTSNRKPMLRVHGDMVELEDLDVIAPDEMKGILMEIAPEVNRKEFDADHDTDFAYELENAGRFRANAFMDHKGPGGVFRIIPSEILTAEQLNLPKAVLDFCTLSKGLVVVTGPTGSGKSTTLAAMIDHINKTRTDHIVTIEDPIEFVHKDNKCLINQREVGTHTQSFRRALRAALREDPDIVLVGEMRDLETMEIAMETAETGHLVFGTLHTSTAASTVDRIIDQFPTDRQSQIRVMLSGSLKGVVAQTLCKRRPKGRVAALEILVTTSGIAAQIRDGKTHQIPSAMQTGSKLGMCLLNDSLLKLVMDKVVAPGEAYLKAISKSDLLDKYEANGVRFNAASISNKSEPAPGAGPLERSPTSQQRTSPASPDPGSSSPEAPLPSSTQRRPQPGSAPRGTNPYGGGAYKPRR